MQCAHSQAGLCLSLCCFESLLLGGQCVRLVLLLFHFVSGLVALLVDALKSGLGNAASLLSHLFEVYGGVIFVLNGACFQEILAGLPTFPFLQ